MNENHKVFKVLVSIEILIVLSMFVIPFFEWVVWITGILMVIMIIGLLITGVGLGADSVSQMAKQINKGKGVE